MRYFYVIDADDFHCRILPSATQAWRERSFGPILKVHHELHTEPHTPFRRDLWRLLVGEILLLSAAEMPQLETPSDSFTRLICHQLTRADAGSTLINQVIEGTRELQMGGFCYRPEQSKWNDLPDVQRLAAWLESIRFHDWSAANLAGSADQDGEGGLAFAQHWFAELLETYRRANQNRCVIVSERL